jgi:hypothetical protein
MKRTIALVATAVMATSVNADSVETYLSKQKLIEQKEQTRQELQLDVEIAELQHELKNVGKEEKDNEQTNQNQRFGNQMMMQRGQQEDEPTYEERMEMADNAALDGLSISSVYPSKKDGRLIAVLVPIEGGQALSVSEGDIVGNWKVTDVTLEAVKADHVEDDDSRTVQYGANY